MMRVQVPLATPTTSVASRAMQVGYLCGKGIPYPFLAFGKEMGDRSVVSFLGRKHSMFDELEMIDWPSLETAYGTAVAIPGALRDLASPNGEVRTAAWETLWSELEHQGTVYQATAYAAPFLVAWLPEVQGEE